MQYVEKELRNLPVHTSLFPKSHQDQSIDYILENNLREIKAHLHGTHPLLENENNTNNNVRLKSIFYLPLLKYKHLKPMGVYDHNT